MVSCSNKNIEQDQSLLTAPSLQHPATVAQSDTQGDLQDILQVLPKTSNQESMKSGTAKPARSKKESLKVEAPIVALPPAPSPSPTPHLNHEWSAQDQASQGLWRQFDMKYLREGERHVMNISYTGLNAATFVLDILPEIILNQQKMFHFKARAKTASYYRWIYELDDTLNSYVDKQSFTPVLYSLDQKEKNKTVLDKLLFNRQSLQVQHDYRKEKNGQVTTSKEVAPIPYYGHDYFSGFYFLRGLPLKIGDQYVFPITTKAKTWLMSVKVEGTQDLTVGKKTVKCLRLTVITKYDSSLAKQGSMTFWISQDNYRAFIKSEADLKIGSIRANLVSYQIGSEVIYADQ